MKKKKGCLKTLHWPAEQLRRMITNLQILWGLASLALLLCPASDWTAWCTFIAAMKFLSFVPPKKNLQYIKASIWVFFTRFQFGQYKKTHLPTFTFWAVYCSCRGCLTEAGNIGFETPAHSPSPNPNP